MTRKEWAKPVSGSEAGRRVTARARYNSKRKQQRYKRRLEIARLYYANGEPARGEQQRLAEKFGVHKATLSRDMAWVRKWLEGDARIGLGLELKRPTGGAAPVPKPRTNPKTFIQEFLAGSSLDRERILANLEGAIYICPLLD